MEKLFSLFERFVVAVEKIAGTLAHPVTVALEGAKVEVPATEPAKPRGRGRPPKDEKPADEAPADAPADDDGWPSDDAPAETAEKVTKDKVRDIIFEYNKKAGTAKAKELLVKNTKNKADKPSGVEPGDFAKVYAAFKAALADEE